MGPTHPWMVAAWYGHVGTYPLPVHQLCAQRAPGALALALALALL